LKRVFIAAGGITPFRPFREARQAEGAWSVRSQRLTLNPLQYPPGGTSGVKEHSTSPTIKTQMVLPVRELPHFEGRKREGVITFIWCVDEIAQGACWTEKEWVLTVADFLGRHAAVDEQDGFGQGCQLGSPLTERWWSTTF